MKKRKAADNEPAADNAGSRGKGDWLGLLNMETKIENMTCYRPHMRLPAGRYAVLKSMHELGYKKYFL